MADEKGKSALEALAQQGSQQLDQLKQQPEPVATSTLPAPEVAAPVETATKSDEGKERKDRRIKSYSMDNDLIVGIEQLKLQAALNRHNLSASDVVNDAVREYLRRRGVAV